ALISRLKGRDAALRDPAGAARRPYQCRLSAWLMLIGFRTAHNEPATEEFLVVQFLHRAFRFLDGLHLDKRKTFRALIVPIAYDLCILHMSNAVEQVEEIALGSVE